MGQGHTPQSQNVFETSEKHYVPQARVWSDMSPGNQPVSLTPDQFQLPVNMLDSLAAKGAASTTAAGHVISQDVAQQGVGASPEQQGSEVSGRRRKRVKRRNSSVSGSPIGDQGMYG